MHNPAGDVGCPGWMALDRSSGPSLTPLAAQLAARAGVHISHKVRSVADIHVCSHELLRGFMKRCRGATRRWLTAGGRKPSHSFHRSSRSSKHWKRRRAAQQAATTHAVLRRPRLKRRSAAPPPQGGRHRGRNTAADALFARGHRGPLEPRPPSSIIALITAQARRRGVRADSGSCRRVRALYQGTRHSERALSVDNVPEGTCPCRHRRRRGSPLTFLEWRLLPATAESVGPCYRSGWGH
jgi:hypothetical protein